MFSKMFKNQQRRANYSVLRIGAHHSPQWLMGDYRKYRTVFEAAEIDFIYVEVVLHNLRFQQEDWSCKMKLIAYWQQMDGTEQKAYEVTEKYTISKDLDRAYLSNSWGAPEKGGYWAQGVCRVEAYIDGQLVGDVYIAIEKENFKNKEINPYFELEEVKIFSTSTDVPPINQRVYSKTFVAAQTPYLAFEINLHNKLDYIWNCEFVGNFYNEEGEQLITQRGLQPIEPTEKKAAVLVSYGNETCDYWHTGKYTVKILFMEKIIDEVAFEVVVNPS
ncbi:MAG: hypothetical protein GY810_22495 [Aureispira sp.]|nr:hypothetical protein [Aureispira sp.]